MTRVNSPLKQRRAGVLLHPTSLPGPLDKGDLGPEAYRFVEFLAASGMTVWQILPLSPTHNDGSPYNCMSSSAGNPELISLDLLIEQGWLSADDLISLHELRTSDPPAFRRNLLRKAHQTFIQHAPETDKTALAGFVKQQSCWLDDYALYQVLKEENRAACWTDWPTELRDRKPQALKQAKIRLKYSITQVYFEQFIFFRQWLALKDYANAHGMQMFGDMPIFVAHDSADVWSKRHNFELDEQGKPLFVAGVPPDYFALQGQRWGHPHYAWKTMQADGFQYWTERMKLQTQLFDIIRIDHFRGFESYWEIPASSATAMDGRWQMAPGDELFQTLVEKIGALPLVAEDLGIITPEVYALRDKYHLPGMIILQFAFDGSPDNPYLPYKHRVNSVVYTGTHDNDTVLGWFNSLTHETKNYVDDYLGSPGEPMPWPLIRCALDSVSLWAIVPMQDILMLGSEHRMNTPGTTQGNWQWRFNWDQLSVDVPARLRHLNQLYGRI